MTMKGERDQRKERQDESLRKSNVRLAWALGIVALLVMLWTMFNLRLHLH